MLRLGYELRHGILKRRCLGKLDPSRRAPRTTRFRRIRTAGAGEGAAEAEPVDPAGRSGRASTLKWQGHGSGHAFTDPQGSFRTMKSNNEYPFCVPLWVPFIRTYLAVVLAKVTSVTEYEAPVVVPYTSVQVVESVDTWTLNALP
jgi:hypothetical protein